MGRSATTTPTRTVSSCRWSYSSTASAVANLTVSLGAKQHSVALYDPKEVGATDEVKWFFVAWDALFSKLPLKPER